MISTIDLSEELYSALTNHKRLMKLLATQLGHIEDDLYKFEEMTLDAYNELSKADLYLHLREVNQTLPLLTEVLNSQIQTIEIQTERLGEMNQQMMANEDIKKDQ